MDKRILKQWDEKQNEIKEWIKKIVDTDPYDINITYEYLLKGILNIINDVECDEELDFKLEQLTTLDHGSYQGSYIFIIPERTYQPSINEYWVTYADYGSCSGCDTLEKALFDTSTMENDLLLICLHLMQQMKSLSVLYAEA